MNIEKPEQVLDAPVLVQTPDVQQLPWRMDGNIREVHLIAAPGRQEMLPGKIIDLSRYTSGVQGSTP